MALQPESNSIGSAPDAQMVLARYLAVSTNTRPNYCSLGLEEGFSTWSSRLSGFQIGTGAVAGQDFVAAFSFRGSRTTVSKYLAPL